MLKSSSDTSSTLLSSSLLFEMLLLLSGPLLFSSEEAKLPSIISFFNFLRFLELALSASDSLSLGAKSSSEASSDDAELPPSLSLSSALLAVGPMEILR